MSDSILSNLKSSSLLQPTKFTLTFKRTPTVMYFCKKFILPGGRLDPVIQAMPFKSRPAAGHKLSYETLHVDFLVEEDMRSWEEIHDWLKDLGTETGYQDYKNLERLNAVSNAALTYRGAYSDAMLTVLSTQNNPRIRFHFFDVFPIYLGDIEFNTQQSAEDIITCQGEFGFHYYELERIEG